jgi:flagellar hook-length control protein FliK
VTIVMTAVDASGACTAGTETSAGSTPDAKAIAQFGALVDDTLGSLENRSGSSESDVDEEEDGETKGGAGTDAAAMALGATPQSPVPTRTTGAASTPTSTTAVESGASAAATATEPRMTMASHLPTATTDVPSATTVDIAEALVTGGDDATTGAAPAADGTTQPWTTAAVRETPATDLPAGLLASPTDDGTSVEGADGSEATTSPAEDDAQPSDAPAHAGSTTAPTAADVADATTSAADTVADPAGHQHLADGLDGAGEPWQQVARAVHGIRRDDDGSHSMTIRLDPPELGSVELEVHIRDGRLHVHATTDSPVTRDVIARAMPELRAALDATGITAGSLEVGARAGGHGLTGQHGSFGDETSGEGRSSTRGGPHVGRPDHGGAIARPSNDQTAAASLTTRLDLRL